MSNREDITNMEHVITYSGTRPIDSPLPEPIAFVLVRNEMLRLPFLLKYYRDMGVRKFIVLDNDSNDESRDYLLAQDDVLFYETKNSYAESGCGLIWTNHILDQVCEDRWCVVIDADELLVWPGSEGESLPQLTARLDACGARAVVAIMVDFYADRSMDQVTYQQGTPFLYATPFFDRGPYAFAKCPLPPEVQFYGGVRHSCFWRNRNRGFSPSTISKIPLIKWQKGYRYLLSTHNMTPQPPLAAMRAGLLHFKMLGDFPSRCRIEVQRGEHFDGARDYKAYLEVMEEGSNCFFDEKVSLRYTGTGQLMALGILSEKHSFQGLYEIKTKETQG
jgi:hypothetical protein